VRGVLYAVGIAVAFGATAGVGYLTLQELVFDERTPASGAPGGDDDAPPSDEPPELDIRAYESFRTIAEDVRDALAADGAEVHAECWRVSGRLHDQAIAMLDWIARNEASPRVRALVVLAAGVHAPDDDALLARLGDHDPRVRRAAVLATGYRERGAVEETLLGVKVPLGRRPPDRTRAELQARMGIEEDEDVAAALKQVLR